ncbi:c-type cytochrome biogenesis protein CcmF [Ahniella affigens]|uniref:C-type cytochrome biogenesis protein CcmF n=1 Tax=Ahniella affigens TaxID=2021234 RepID=A0A2P1PQF7_9GAMM|nr:heme lyase CcmF/NrfE family subunit [Ahniella affigens]AVP97073.1 c-type cytochrome biogenesis protein CcmF [Ahniella affigens]
MMPELGQFALLLALVLSALQFALPLLGAHYQKARWMALAGPAALMQFLVMLVSFCLLAHAFVVQDFSVAYVAQNSNLDLPAMYRVSAVWGAHEGSLLLWALILSLWTALVAIHSRDLPAAFYARVLSVLGFINVGFLAFMIITSNPFLRHLPGLPDGADLNPLLQDPGLIIHPPMLYMGYVGFSVAFAFAVAAMIEGRIDSRWIKWVRPWTLWAWSFLTLGIALGSWWAYYELGWGGWWFWDPVENASFMPWLVGTALIHSQSVVEKRQQLVLWTLLLSILAFSLSLLGTFLVRSGVLTSVHAFASDPERGVFILAFLAAIAGGALALFSWRFNHFLRSFDFGLVSRETGLLINNLVMTTACLLVLLGTLFPLLADAMGWGKVSVGSPFFGLTFPIMMMPIVFLLPFGPFLKWRQDQVARVAPSVKWAALAAVVIAGVCIAFGAPWKAAVGVLIGSWILVGCIEYVRRFRADPARRSRGLGREHLGMLLAHAGMGVFVIGVLVTESSSIEKDVRLEPGQSVEISGLSIVFEKMDHYQGPNFNADQGHFVIKDGDQEVARLHPEKRGYRRGEVMTEAAIDPGLTRDLYVALGEPLGGNDAWAVRVYYKPFIRWIWLGALMMMFGGLIASFDARLRRTEPAKAAISDGVQTA